MIAAKERIVPHLRRLKSLQSAFMSYTSFDKSLCKIPSREDSIHIAPETLMSIASALWIMGYEISHAEFELSR